MNTNERKNPEARDKNPDKMNPTEIWSLESGLWGLRILTHPRLFVTAFAVGFFKVRLRRIRH